MAVTQDANDPNRNFCPRCGTMWSPWEDRARKKLLLKCRNCSYSEPADNSKPVNENYIVRQLKNQLDTISPAVGQDPTLYQTLIEGGCKHCGGIEAVIFQAEAGAKANSLKLVWVCKSCGNKWI